MLVLWSSLAVARPVEVILDMPKELIQDHTVAVSLGVRLKDGNILGRQLFDLKDLRGGITSKTIDIDQEVVNCEFSWAIANKPPLIPGETPAPRPDLVVPVGFDGIAKGKCSINQDDEIRLTPASLKFWVTESLVELSAFAKHQAERVIASVQPVSSQPGEKFASWTLDGSLKSAPLRVEKRILAQGNPSFEVSTLWIQKTGNIVREAKKITGMLVVID